eukprot:UN00477
MTKKPQIHVQRHYVNNNNTTTQSQSRENKNKIRSVGLSSRSKGYRAQRTSSHSSESVASVGPVRSIRPAPIRPVC